MTYHYWMEVDNQLIGTVKFLAPLSLKQKARAEQILAEKKAIRSIQLIPYGEFKIQKSMAFVMMREAA